MAERMMTSLERRALRTKIVRHAQWDQLRIAYHLPSVSHMRVADLISVGKSLGLIDDPLPAVRHCSTASLLAAHKRAAQFSEVITGELLQRADCTPCT